MFERFLKLCYVVMIGAFSIMALVMGLDAVDSSSFLQKLRERRERKKYSQVEKPEDED